MTILLLAAVAVNVFIGTDGKGNVTLAACVPFGMVQAGPDTSARADGYDCGKQHCSGYQFGDPYVWRFSQTHVSGTGVPSNGDFGLLPLTDGESGDCLAMDKATESAAPGRYAVTLANGVRCEVAATPHSAVYRLTYPKGRRAQLLVDLDWGLMDPASGATNTFQRTVYGTAFKSDSPVDLRGYRHVQCYFSYTMHFAARCSAPICEKTQVREADGRRGEVWRLDFGELPDGVLEFQIALSMTSQSAARRNLEAERCSFDAAAQAASEAWDDWLARVTPSESTPTETVENLRAAMYHLAIHPNDIGDVGSPRFATFSLWDTFRAAHPLFTILTPEQAVGFARGLLTEGEEMGRLPILSWFGKDTHCMIGHHAVPVLVDAFLKERDGTLPPSGIDWNRAWELVKDSLTVEHVSDSTACWGFLKEDWNLYNAYGYLPFDLLRTRTRDGLLRGESVARTYECAYDDACAARMAEALGHEEDAKFFRRRAGFWRNVFDASVGFARGKDSKGRWREPFDPAGIGFGPFEDNDFCEGNSWQYTWHVMQDPEGLVAALGGPAVTGERLDRLFSTKAADGEKSYDVCGLIGQYAHGNEVSHHIPYLYAYTDRPGRTADVLREIFATQYAPRPDGLCGNDDCGQMSAWYVFSALGFYPVDPCGKGYVLGAPQLPAATIRLPGGKAFAVEVRNFGGGNRYVKSVSLNGRTVSGRTLEHADVMRGGTLTFEMTSVAPTAVASSALDGTRAKWMSGKYGLMVHWLTPDYTGDAETVDAPVESFDLQGFLEDFDASGAAWLMFPIGQNRGTYASPNAVIERLCGKGHCSKRDLVKELADAMHARGKRFVAYLPCETRMNTTIRDAVGWIDGDTRQEKFQKIWTEVIAEWSRQYGRSCDGWWFDGAYDSLWPNGVDEKAWTAAVCAGNPDSILSFNNGQIPQFHSDYLGGEIAWIKDGKLQLQDWALPRAHELTSDPLVLDKENPPTWMPKGPLCPNGRCLRHVLLPVDGFWGLYNPWPWCWIVNHWPELTRSRPELTDRFWMDERRRRGEFIPAAYTAETLMPFVRGFTGAGGAVTVNVGITDEGRMNPESISLLAGRTYVPRPTKAPPSAPKGLLRRSRRIVLVGDSITEIGQCAVGGYYHEVTNALRTVYGKRAPDVYPAGFSGSEMGSWLVFEERSKTQSVVSGGADMCGRHRDVREALGETADVVMVFLGMNDILCPTVRDTRKSWDEWKEKARALGRRLKDRTGAKTLAFATITPLTNEFTGPKNAVRDELNKRLRELAVEEDALIVPFGEAIEDLIKCERAIRPDAQAVPDFVHPNVSEGHLALAATLLKALGEPEAAKIPETKLEERLSMMRRSATGLSWWLDASRARRVCENVIAYEINWTLDPKLVPGAGTEDVEISIRAPEKWDNIHPKRQRGATFGTFCLWIVQDRLRDTVTLEAKNLKTGKTVTAEVPVTMPWLVASVSETTDQWRWNETTKSFDWLGSNVVFASEAELARGIGFDRPVTERGGNASWRLVTPTLDYTGLDDPDSLDTYAYSFGSNHDTWYAARWIDSPKKRTVRLQASHKTFSDTLGMRVWLNGKPVLVDTLDRRGKNRTRETLVELEKGTNLLFIRCDHHDWQRQFSVSLMPTEGDDLGDLTYSARPDRVTVVGPDAGRGVNL